MNCFPWGAIQVEKFGRFLSIRKTYFLQVINLILVGTLEKCAFCLSSILILKSCVVGHDRELHLSLKNSEGNWSRKCGPATPKSFNAEFTGLMCKNDWIGSLLYSSG
ncbi:hypothetical protein B1J93_12415 [Leptospira kirschneri serovar Pomona]|uniref:Uncharacterized protein n=1 Tax=Leptospira kirschneri serovar Pomona TaxID=561005 RepID=A0A1T1DM31_9LEPT|nr:hypothetical protein B1J93_12415 [Leptospira kirschneri serovar Pomona]